MGERGGLRWLRPGRFLRDLNILALLIVIAAGAALLLLPASDDGLLGLPALALGEEAPRTIKSPRAFVIADLETTERLRIEAAENVLPIYDHQTARGAEAKAKIEAAFAAEASARSADGGVTAQEFLLALELIIDESALEPLIRAPIPDEMRDAAIMIAQTAHEPRIVEDRALLRLQAPQGFVLRSVDRDGHAEREEIFTDTSRIEGIDRARARVDDLVAEHMKRFTVEQRRAVATLVKRLLEPNVEPNRLETERRAEAARQAVKTVLVAVNPGETVLRAGERVTQRHQFILIGIEQELRAQSRAQAAVGSALLISLLVVILYRFRIRADRYAIPTHRDLAFLASSYVVMLLVIWGGYKATIWLGESFPLIGVEHYRFVLPVAGGALLVRFVLGAEHAAAFGVLSSITAGWMMDANLGFAAYALAGSFAAISIKNTAQPRTALLTAGLRAAFAQALLALSLALLDSQLSLEGTLAAAALSLLSGLLSTFIAALLVPPVEVLFGYTTDMKLVDLANLNHPLLRELLVETPGTYHHSILVATLAEAAAKKIHANTLLARVGGYYHDIGKIKNPRGFDENVQNNYVSVLAADEAKEIRAHVADGLELAAKHRLGPPLYEIIAQHHGTSVVRNAYRRGLESGDVVERSDYAYPGPKPISREAALVLIADCVETATRELVLELSLDRKMIEEAVKAAVEEVRDDGQLDRSDLSLRDIDRIVEELTNVLEDRLIKRGRPTLSGIPRLPSQKSTRPPLLN
jgi:putative nucleotidyltransferase with HDIG domain